MWFKIVCYNGTNDEITASTISEAVDKFCKKHELHETNIKSVERMF